LQQYYLKVEKDENYKGKNRSRRSNWTGHAMPRLSHATEEKRVTAIRESAEEAVQQPL